MDLLKEDLERTTGFEPARTAWEAVMLPLHHIRTAIAYYKYAILPVSLPLWIIALLIPNNQITFLSSLEIQD